MNHGEDFVEQLGRYLFRTGLTQQELANKTGLHRNTIGKWMNRTSLPEFRGPILRVADELILSKEERKAFIQAAGFLVDQWPTEVWTVPQQQDQSHRPLPFLQIKNGTESVPTGSKAFFALIHGGTALTEQNGESVFLNGS